MYVYNSQKYFSKIKCTETFYWVFLNTILVHSNIVGVHRCALTDNIFKSNNIFNRLSGK